MSKIEINKKDYELKITLGFWKNLSFPRSELESIAVDGKKMFEVIKLAIYYGSKQANGWHCIKDMELEITDEVMDDLDMDSGTLYLKFEEAIFNSYPKDLQDAIKKASDDSKEEDSKKN